jgi:hypothetical protein
VGDADLVFGMQLVSVLLQNFQPNPEIFRKNPYFGFCFPNLTMIFFTVFFYGSLSFLSLYKFFKYFSIRFNFFLIGTRVAHGSSTDKNDHERLKYKKTAALEYRVYSKLGMKIKKS